MPPQRFWVLNIGNFSEDTDQKYTKQISEDWHHSIKKLAINDCESYENKVRRNVKYVPNSTLIKAHTVIKEGWEKQELFDEIEKFVKDVVAEKGS